MSSSQDGRHSANFLKIYETLSLDAKQELLDKHLFPLLDRVPGPLGQKIVNSASRLQKRFEGMPELNLLAKTEEIETLLKELDSDARMSFIKERSRRNELLLELLDTISLWLADIWSVACEYKTDFEMAHRCLKLVANALDGISNGGPGCKCFLHNMNVSVVIKRLKTGKTVHAFYLKGALSLTVVLLWVWRDMILTILAYGTERQKKCVPQMLEDIQLGVGWIGLVRLLMGGKRLDEDEDGDLTDCGDDEEEWYDEDADELNPHSSCPVHAEHWPAAMNAHLPFLNELVNAQMLDLFRTAPSKALYLAIQTMPAQPPDTLRSQLQQILQDYAYASSDSFCAALEIFLYEDKTDQVLVLLDKGTHLLRPRDAPIFQSAVTKLGQNRLFRARMLGLVEKELNDTIRHIHTSLLTLFSGLSNPAHIKEAKTILKLAPDSNTRQDRVEQWIEAVSTPGSVAPNPLAFAAMMMGIPIPGSEDAPGDADPAGLLDMDDSDPELDDLRDEFRPKMQERFRGWTDTATSIPSGAATLLQVFQKAVASMPFLLGPDMVEEMLNRISDKPNKHYIGDALDALHSFAKAQRKKLVKKQAKAANSAHRRGETPGASSDTRSSAPAPALHTFGGIEDVD